MNKHDIVSSLKIKHMARAAELTPLEMEIVLSIRYSGSMVTPTVNRLLGVNRASMNQRIGPRLEEKGWLKHTETVHRQRKSVPTKRWYVPESKLETLRKLTNDAQDELNNTITYSFTKDLDWIPTTECLTEEKVDA